MNKRLIYLDNLRIFLISYVIAGHISVAYGAIGRGNWYYIEPVPDFLTKAVLFVFDMLAYSFLMAMFIFVAGYFTPASLERKGIYKFLKDRVIRLFIPLIAYYFIIGPLVKYISMLAKGNAVSLSRFFGDMYHSGVYGYVGVMWFVELMLVFSFMYAAYKLIFPSGLFKLKSEEFPGNWSVFIFIILFGLASFGSRMLFPMGGGYMASRPLASMVLFATSFFLGITAFKYQWLDKLTDAMAYRWFWIALVVMVAPVIAFVILKKSVGFGTIKGAGSAASLVYSYWEVIKCIGTGMLVIVLFRKRFNTQGKIAAAMGRGTFAAYVFHPLICVILMLIMSDVSLHPLLKFAIVAPTALVLTFGFSWLFLKIPGMGKVF